MVNKAIHVLVAAAFVLASCSDDTLQERHGTEIRFRTAVGMNTRALSTDLAGLRQSGIFVSAFASKGNEKYEFKELTFKYEDGNGWGSNPVRYWPEDGSELRFVATSPDASSWGGSFEGEKPGELKVTGFSPETEIGKQKDLLAGYTSGNKNNTAGVGLEMRHALTQVEVRAKSSDKAYFYDVKAVRIGSVRSTGDYTLPSETNASGNWTLKEGSYASYTTVNMEEPVRLVADAKSMMGDGGTAMLLPQQLTAWDMKEDKENTKNGSYIALLLKITTEAGTQVYPTTTGEYGWAAVAIGSNWQAGDKFIYTLDLSNGAGVVPPKPAPDPDPKPDPDPDPDPDPGEPILGEPIRFTVEVNGWTLRQQEENLGE